METWDAIRVRRNAASSAATIALVAHELPARIAQGGVGQVIGA